MTDRILLLLKSMNLSPSQLADEISVQRSSVSHILSGRNKPSLDFITKVLSSYPQISSDWLLFGKGTMIRQAGKTKSDNANELKGTEKPKEEVDHKKATATIPEQKIAEKQVPAGEMKEAARQTEKEIREVLILYCDNTFRLFKHAQ
jgi:transcriptional regulator with XRE-family HTH domain